GVALEIFKPFFTTRTRGTGLGLALAKRIAEEHGGTITAKNHPAGGAEFTIRLPELNR
ncbi:MAG: PAS domain-containing sensor histidine kinase, partial [Planctomycetes bacterium]|nr:PAS domain-containing sensor histidine kinase [Planctomycetota bacterium]